MNFSRTLFLFALVAISINYNTCSFTKTKLNSCSIDEECPSLNVCSSEGVCKHKDPSPISFNEITGLVMVVFGSALSNAGGIGGGGLLIPILILLLKFDTHEAIPISKIMIFTGALTAFIMGLKNKNPYKDTPAIDYNIAVILVPFILFGTMLGVTLNKVMPPWIILTCLTICLVISSYKTMNKGLKLWEKEKDEIEENERINAKPVLDSKENFASTDCDENDDEDNAFLAERATYSPSDPKLAKNSDKENNLPALSSPVVEEIIKDKTLFPQKKIMYLLGCYCFLFIITFVKGSEHCKSLFSIKSCSGTYWLIYFSYFPISILLTYYVGQVVFNEYNRRVEIGYPFHHSDIPWTFNKVLKYPVYGLISGTMAGLLGIGGGLILGPMLLELGIHPIISTATSNFLVLFTASSTSMQFIVMGMLNLKWGFVCTIASTIGSYIGTTIIQKLITKTGRSSILVFTLGLVLCTSTIFIPWHTFTQIKEDLQLGRNIWTFHSPC